MFRENVPLSQGLGKNQGLEITISILRLIKPFSGNYRSTKIHKFCDISNTPVVAQSCIFHHDWQYCIYCIMCEDNLFTSTCSCYLLSLSETAEEWADTFYALQRECSIDITAIAHSSGHSSTVLSSLCSPMETGSALHFMK
jgi:hypothetical protein